MCRLVTYITMDFFDFILSKQYSYFLLAVSRAAASGVATESYTNS